MLCIVEVQGFCISSEYNFMPKEVVILSDKYFKKFIVEPPQDINLYSRKDQKAINWAVNKYHNIFWDQGNISYANFKQILQFDTRQFTHVCTKGAEKAKFLSNVLKRKVYDLTLYDCPKIRTNLNESCDLHFKYSGQCAEKAAEKIQHWLDGKPSIKKAFGDNK